MNGARSHATRVYSDLLKHTGIYSLGQILARSASLLLLPVYTSHLTPADYGRIAVLDLTAAVLGILIGSGMGAAATRYHVETRSEAEQGQVWWTACTLVVVVSLAVVLPLWFVRDTLARLTLGAGQTNGSYYYALVLSTLFFAALGMVPDYYLRARKWSGLYVGLSVVGLLVNIVLNVYLLVVVHLGIAGILWGNLIANALSTGARLVVFQLSVGRYAFHLSFGAKLWRFGSPIVVTALLATVMHQADRYLLRLFLDLDQVGVYSLAYNIAHAASTLVLLPFSAIWTVLMYEIADRPDADAVYTSVFKYSVYLVALFLFGISLFAKPLLSVLAPPDYADAADLVPIICLAYIFFSFHIHFRVPAMLYKRTVSLLPAFSAGAAVNVIANVILIPPLGYWGAAWASVISFFAFSFIGLSRYSRIKKYKYPLGTCGAVVGGMIISVAACRWLATVSGQAIWSIGVPALVWVIWAVVLLRSTISHLAYQPIPESGVPGCKTALNSSGAATPHSRVRRP